VKPGDKVALISKNTAWWLMTDFAIWLAGGVSVPLYPTLAAETIRQILTHSEATLLFIGKLDGWAGMKPGVPAGLRCIRMPLAPPMAEMPRAPRTGRHHQTLPAAGRQPGARRRRAVDHHVHLGHHRAPRA